nr:MAG TPA: hypothetical protein [Caudoviricetes sp.]
MDKTGFVPAWQRKNAAPIGAAGRSDLFNFETVQVAVVSFCAQYSGHECDPLCGCFFRAWFGLGYKMLFISKPGEHGCDICHRQKPPLLCKKAGRGKAVSFSGGAVAVGSGLQTGAPMALPLMRRVSGSDSRSVIDFDLGIGQAGDFHAVDPLGIGIEFICDIGTGTIRGKGQATMHHSGQQVEDFILGSAVGVGRDNGFINGIVGHLETDGEQLEAGFILVVEVVDGLLDVVAQIAL